MQLVFTDELPRFLERTLSKHDSCDDAVLDTLAHRINSTPNAHLFAAAMTGLDLAQAHRVIRGWLNTVEAQTVPKAQRALPAQLAIANIEPPDIGHEVMFVPACRRFTEIRDEAAANCLSLRLMHRLGASGMRGVLATVNTIPELSKCAAALGGLKLPTALLDEFIATSPPLLDTGFDDVVSLLEVANALDRSVASAWVNRVGQEALFQRFNESVPWTTVPNLEPCDEGRQVRADVWYVAPTLQGDIHNSVVRSCEVLLALTPSADVVASNALGPDGKVLLMDAEHPLVTKRIPRASLPCRPVVARNRAWIAVLDSQLATSSYTAYLSKCLELTREVNRTLKTFFDAFFRGIHDSASLAVLGQVYETCRTLFAPHEEQVASTKQRSSQLQFLLSSCSSDLLRRFAELPNGAPAYIGWMNSLLETISKAKTEEPWEVLSMLPPKELDELSRIVEGFQALAGEAFVRNRSPLALHITKGAAKGRAFDRACTAAHQFRKAKLEALETSLRSEFCSDDDGLSIFLLRDAAIPAFWPPADVLICLNVDTPEDIDAAVSSNWPRWRKAIDSGRKICLLPVMNGHALAHLAMAGFEALFPAINDADAWCAVAGAPPLPRISVAAFTRISNALAELDGIREYWAVKGGRTALEQGAHEQAQATLEQASLAFHTLDIPDELKAHVQQFADRVLGGSIELAVDILTFSKVLSCYETIRG